MEGYKKVTWISITLTFVIAIVVGYLLFFSAKDKSPEPIIKNEPEKKIEIIQEDPKSPVEEETINSDLNPLDLELNESDMQIRELASPCLSNPIFKEWLGNEDLVRTLVASVSAIAEGESPVFLLQFLAPGKKFQASRQGDTYYMNSKIYTRYDKITKVFVSLDKECVSLLFKRLKPTFTKAFKELGFPHDTFESRLKRAFSRLLSTPVITGRVKLERKVVSYAFADPKLENLKPIQKHLIRMGPDNQKKIQQKLREIAQALNLDLKE